MVLKVSKHGIRSGNSLKARAYSDHRRHYKKHSLIFRNLILTGENVDKENFLGEVDVRKNSIPYSMNKKGRWELPDLIKTSIEEGEFDDEEFAVQLVERHKLKNHTNCISIHTSKKPKDWKGDERCRKRKIGYLNVDSILSPRYYNLTRRERHFRINRGLPIEEEDEEPVQVPSSVRYEVLYPPSQTSALAHIPRYSGYYSTKGANCYCRRRCICNITRRKQGRKRCHDDILEDISVFDDDVFENDCPVQKDEFDNSSSNRESSITVCLSDFLCSSPPITKPKKRRRRKSISTSDISDLSIDSKHIVFEEVPANPSTKEEIITTETSTYAEKLNPISVNLPNEELDHQKLSHKYGQNYMECDCFPRKFVIDISNRVRHLRSCDDNEQTPQNEVIASVMFSCDTEKEVTNETESIYKVTLNTTCLKYPGRVKIETLFDYMQTTVEECLTRTVLFMETLPELYVDKKSLPSVHKLKNPRTSHIERLAKWESEAYQPSNSFYYSKYMLKDKRTVVSDDDTLDALERYKLKTNSGHESKYCDICYEVLGNEISGTALCACQHWFCDSCWTEYFETRVNSGATTLTCPEFDCDETVDPGTVVTLLNLRDVIRHAKFCHDNEVESGITTQWCPNSKCDRVLKVNERTAQTTNCHCGQVFCFDCLRMPHWPATCEAFGKYFKKLEETGDIGLVPVESLDRVIVNGKNCPHCRKFLEKDGGCPYMSCVCGNSFCWGCGKDWDSNNHDNKCYKFGMQNEHMTSEVVVEDDRLKRNNKKIKWYNIAVKHRSEQHQLKRERLKIAGKKVIHYLSSYIGKSNKKGIMVGLDFEGSRTNYRNEQDKLPEFLHELIALSQELHQLLENTAVMIESTQIPQNKMMHIGHVHRRLASFAQAIEIGLLQGLETKPEALLTMFKKVRMHCNRSIECLFVTVNKLGL